jgi:hypothetical protein
MMVGDRYPVLREVRLQNSMRSPRFPDGDQIIDGNSFAVRAHKKFGSMPYWSAIDPFLRLRSEPKFEVSTR